MKKIAVLFGNNNYNTSPLDNAINDAKCLSEKLNNLNFETEAFYDIDIIEMEKCMRVFSDKLKQADVGLFFFAGHGIQLKGENFLATIDTSFYDDVSCKRTSYSLSEVINILDESKVSTKIIILDACRNNPFPSTYRSATVEGLAPVYAPKGTIIAFATSPGQKASDGSGENGVYTTALLTHIGTKKITIEDMFKRVRNTVSAQTKNKQITWEHTSLMGNFYFNLGYDMGELITTYSNDALCDSKYTFDLNNSLQEIIEKLQSYNWDTQNIAINSLGKIDMTGSDIDDLFVLGRNIYQTACGGSFTAQSWMDNLEYNLNKFSESVSFHILNGILFEIYFNSDGKLRNKLRTGYYEYPISLCAKDRYGKSALFIASYLTLNQQKILFLPGNQDDILLDVDLEKIDDVTYNLLQIYINGLPCLYDEECNHLYSYNDYSYLYEIEQSKFENLLRCSIAAPKNKFKIHYTNNLTEGAIINSPHKINLCNYAN